MEGMNGIFTALFTPFTAEGEINRKALEQLIQFNIESGVTGFYAGGSTAEAMLMQDAQRMELLRLTKEIAGNRVKLIAHIGSASTTGAVAMGKEAEKLGYDAISAVAPYYYVHRLDAIKQYYYDITDAVDLPLFIYNFSLATGFSLTVDIAEEFFAKNDRFAGIKHTSLDLYTLHQFKEKLPNATILNGYDEVCLGGLAMGADGAIGSTFNFMAKKYVKLYNAFQNGDMATAQQLQNEACKIITVMLKYGVLQCEKEIVTQMGIGDMGPCLRPNLPLSDEGKKAVSELIALV